MVAVAAVLLSAAVRADQAVALEALRAVATAMAKKKAAATAVVTPRCLPGKKSLVQKAAVTAMVTVGKPAMKRSRKIQEALQVMGMSLAKDPAAPLDRTMNLTKPWKRSMGKY